MANEVRNNPWKGLTFYTEGEVLYGRNAEIQSLSQYIFNNTQTVLYGRSGIGKSSILNAGIFPKARQAGMVPVGIRLKHEEINNYLLQVRSAIAASGLKLKEIVPAVEDEERETLWEFMHRHDFLDSNGEKCVPLFVFDQFEEIFTLQRREGIKREFFSQLGDLLNDVKPAYIVEYEKKNREMQSSQQEAKVVSSGAFKGLSLKLNIRRNDNDQESIAHYKESPDYHIVFAMREDFLSSLELYAASIPVMKDNRFGLLPINEEQAADIIRLPRIGLVDADVTKLIIQQVTGNFEFDLDGRPEIEVDAAVLSLFLSRLYEKKAEADQKITAELVNTYSGHIINDFYIDSIDSNEEENEILSKETILLLENQLLTSEGRRNNVSRSDLIAQGATNEELNILIDKRKLLRQFHHGNDIRVEYIHDILCPVVKDRIEQREMLQQQELERERQEEERRELLAHQRKEKHKMFVLLSLAAAVILIIVSWLVLEWYRYECEVRTYYADFTRKNGWPVGVGEELNERDAKKLTTFYCLIKHGHGSENNTEVLISPGRTLAPHQMRLPLVGTDDNSNDHARSFSAMLRKTRRIVFYKGVKESTAKETAYDDMGNVLFITNYYDENNIRWATYSHSNGAPIKLNGDADRMRIVTDTVSGMDLEYMFFDAQGIPCMNDMKDYGYAMQYDDKCRLTEVRHLNAFRDVIYTERREYSGSHNYTIAYDGNPNGCSSIEVSTDDKGNIVERHYHYANVMNKPEFEDIVYNPDGLIVERKWSDGNHKPFKGRGTEAAHIIYAYENASMDMCAEIHLSASKDTLYKYTLTRTLGSAEKRSLHHSAKGMKTVTNTNERRDSIVQDWVQHAYTHKRSLYFKGYLVEEAFFGIDGAPVYSKKDEYHKVVVKTDVGKTGEKKVFRTYYDENNCLYQTDVTRSESHYDAMGNRTFYRTFDYKGDILTSMAYEYENGVEKTRYVVGVNGDPIRCPEWESEGLCYYKLHSVRDFSNKLAQLYAVGESGLSTLLYGAPTYAPDTISTRNIGCNWMFYTLKLTKSYIPGSNDIALNYVHLLKKGGEADKAGIKDGDILVSGTLLPEHKVMLKRYNRKSRKVEALSIELPKVHNLDAEVYPVYFTREEYEKLWK